MGHKWHFFRAGGVDQVAIRNGADLLALPELDQKLWVALAMPTRDVAIDPATMDLLDDDQDGRVRIPDIQEATKWIGATWKNADEILKGGDTVSLSGIKDATMAAAARRVLADLGKGDATSISLAQAADVVKTFVAGKLNGDGVIDAGSTDDAGLKAAIEDALKAGSVPDRSGKPGLDQAKLDAFFAAVDEAVAWHEAGKGLTADGDAADALAAVQAKLDDYFARTALASYDGRAAAGLNGQEADFTALGAKALTLSADDIARLPLARIEAGRPLALGAGINPAWTDKVAVFADKAVKPILGAKDAITAADLATITAKLAPLMTWRAARPATEAAKLDAARLTALAAPDVRKRLTELVAADLALASDYQAIASVEKLCRFQRDFATVVRNFVNFSDFYSKRDGVFQTGTLYLDGRAFHLTVPVTDAGKHGALAGRSAAYLAYCDLSRAGATRTIAAAVTNGDGDNLFVGRNGVFYDRDGADWDATISSIVTNPISVRQAFFAPYKKLVRVVEDMITKRASDAEAKSMGKVDATANKIATVDQAPAAAGEPAPPPPKKGFDIGIIAVISLAIGAVVGALGGLLAAVVGMGVWAPLGIAGLLAVISGPSMILAWMKLRQRNLGPILDANGWAVNIRARVNVAFGARMTDLGELPQGSTRSVDDPYADRQGPWKLYLVLVLLLVLLGTWFSGKLDRWLPGSMQSVAVFGSYAPAAKPLSDVLPATPAPAAEAPAAPAPAPAP